MGSGTCCPMNSGRQIVHLLDRRLWKVGTQVLDAGQRETVTCRGCGRVRPVAVRVRPDTLYGAQLDGDEARRVPVLSLCAGCALDRLMASWPHMAAGKDGQPGIVYARLVRKDMQGPRWLGR